MTATTLPPGRPFTTQMALDSGVSPDALRTKRYRRLFRGVYVSADVEPDLFTWLHAALLLMPGDAVVSHVSAMALYDLSPPRRFERLSFSTATPRVVKDRRIELHRRRGRLTHHVRHHLPVTGPDRTFVDCALRLTFVELVQLGDHLVHLGLTTPARLAEYAAARHLDGVRRARRVVRWVREGVESPRETSLRLMLVLSRLPEPECNPEITDAAGRFLARADLVYWRWRIVVEYDGWHHERDAAQRAKDIRRRERLEAEGWRVIVVTSGDFSDPRSIPWRVFVALRSRGYDGPGPVLNDSWCRWFGVRFHK